MADIHNQNLEFYISFHQISCNEHWTFCPNIFTTIFESSSDTELLHLLCPDHAGPVQVPGLDHLPHLAPGEGGGVKLQNSGESGEVTAIVTSCELPQCHILNSLSIKLTSRNDLVV